jgi:glycosyltransferase involved in cell wall biosynthesis
MPKISIITVVKDHEVGLTETFKSIQEQEFQEWELIIVVGNSSDKTLETALVLQESDVRIRVLEQNGFGIYPAMNQGLGAAVGEYIWFMNAGDEFYSSVTLQHALGIIRTSNVGLLIGGYGIEKSLETKFYPNKNKRVRPYSFAFNRRSGCHQSMLFRSNSIMSFGGFNTSFSLASDFDLALRIIQQFGATSTSEIFAIIEPGGAADKGIKLVHKEKHSIRQNVLGSNTIRLASIVWTILAKSKSALRSIFIR